MSSVMSLQEENRVLQGELARLEDLLAHSRADRDELAIKYSAISERVSQQQSQTFCHHTEREAAFYLKVKRNSAHIHLYFVLFPFKQFWCVFV